MSYHQLTEHERYQIYSLLKVGLTQKQIACHLGPALWTSNLVRPALWTSNLVTGFRYGEHCRLNRYRQHGFSERVALTKGT
ncbi:hypothetical protein CHH28_04120 [Bacterioplanes sanyensis]|uniref:Transposase IS30-like HTH domain-containing protein n=1 Tax=Bacterioplanes sanyensis TaxID=1249553 RepID=A0A222FHM6_9GAMM|nr:hypothetical protein CHH28_04120 [Bacterioplanes sanyensis]